MDPAQGEIAEVSFEGWGMVMVGYIEMQGVTLGDETNFALFRRLFGAAPARFGPKAVLHAELVGADYDHRVLPLGRQTEIYTIYDRELLVPKVW